MGEQTHRDRVVRRFDGLPGGHAGGSLSPILTVQREIDAQNIYARFADEAEERLPVCAAIIVRMRSSVMPRAFATDATLAAKAFWVMSGSRREAEVERVARDRPAPPRRARPIALHAVDQLPATSGEIEPIRRVRRALKGASTGLASAGSARWPTGGHGK